MRTLNIKMRSINLLCLRERWINRTRSTLDRSRSSIVRAQQYSYWCYVMFVRVSLGSYLLNLIESKPNSFGLILSTHNISLVTSHQLITAGSDFDTNIRIITKDKIKRRKVIYAQRFHTFVAKPIGGHP